MKVLIALITIISWLLVHQAQVQASSVFNYAAAAATVASQSKLLLHWLENHDPDELRNTSELIRSKGYVAEEHDVQTDDGYILSIQRIPHGINGSQSSGPRPVVLLQHGLFDCSATWVMNFPSQSLGFILADAGYDVWLGNMRGNTYGMRHVKYNPKTDDAFWNFSFDEMAKHDLPSMINYVLKQTNQSSLYYVGHSQGTLIGFIQFGQDPALAAKVKAFAALGPVATVGHIVSPLKYIADVGRNSTQLIWYQFLGRKQMMTSSALERWLADFMCNVEEFDKVFCENILFIFCGPSKHMNMTRIPVYTTHDPAGTSVKNLIHFSQGVISDKFQKFDYGSAKANMAAYNQPTPPEYSLKPVTLPVGLFWAKDDWLADPVDVKYLKQNLPNVVYEQYIDDWNHLDFIWAIDAAARMYPNIINLFRKFP